MDLSNHEIRVLGCLLEKQRTTPDHYPPSLNSLRLACNQSTNRDPVVDYDDATIRDALHRLGRRGYARLAGVGRAAKYRHLLSEALPMSDAEQALMCVLMLRGRQTPGELKQRAERIHAFADLDEVHATLAALIARDLVTQLHRRPGQKEDRYAQLLGGEQSGERESHDGSPEPQPARESHDGSPEPQPARESHNGSPEPQPARAQEGQPSGASPRPPDDLYERVARLEREVAELRDVIQS